MRPQLFAFCYGVFIIGTALSLIVGGGWFGTQQVDVINQLTGISATQIQAMGGWTILKAIPAFITGVLTMITWNYPYLSSPWVTVFKLVFLFPVSAMVIYGLYELFLPVLQGIGSAIRSLLP